MTDMEYSRKDRSISSWISIGSMAPETGPPPFPEPSFPDPDPCEPEPVI